MAWTQAYDPLHSWILSTLVAALPILVLFGLLAGLRVRPHWCAIAGAGTAGVGAVTGFGRPFPRGGVGFLCRGGVRVLHIGWRLLAAGHPFALSPVSAQFESM